MLDIINLFPSVSLISTVSSSFNSVSMVSVFQSFGIPIRTPPAVDLFLLSFLMMKFNPGIVTCSALVTLTSCRARMFLDPALRLFSNSFLNTRNRFGEPLRLPE